MSRPPTTRILTGLLLNLALLTPLAAQSGLYVQEADDKFHAVFKVVGVRPYIMQKDKLVAAKGQRLALKKVEEYLPILITVRDKETTPTTVRVDYASTPTNNGMRFSAKFEAADRLTDVFIVVEVMITNVGQKLYAFEIGRLEPHTPKPFSADLALGQYMGSGQITFRLFVGGSEVFHSEQPEAYREEQLDRMIAKRIAGVQQAGPKPFYGTTPAYPAALRGTGLNGEAVVTLRISEQGRVIEPVVLDRATAPPFGEEAMAAVRQWRFVPRVKAGSAVETKVSIPFAFDPPQADQGKH